MKRTWKSVERANSAKRKRLVLGEAAHRHRVDLDRPDRRVARDRLQAAQDLRERVAAGHLEEPVALQRIDRDVDAPMPAATSAVGVALQQVAVGGDRQVVEAATRASRTTSGNSRARAVPRRSGARPSRPSREQAHQPLDLLEGEDLERSSHGSPSAGMQYWQRKLQRSVTETRRSPMRRPWPSHSGSALICSQILAHAVTLPRGWDL